MLELVAYFYNKKSGEIIIKYSMSSTIMIDDQRDMRLIHSYVLLITKRTLQSDTPPLTSLTMQSSSHLLLGGSRQTFCFESQQGAIAK